MNGSVFYKLKEDPHGVFSINGISGALSVTTPLSLNNSDNGIVAVAIEAYNTQPYTTSLIQNPIVNVTIKIQVSI